jgi:type II secretory pathway pseudopilin PulG
MGDPIMSRTLRNQRGTTLVEALVAMTILLVAAAGTLGLQLQGVRMDSDARHITRATAIAQDLIDQIALWPYTDPRLANATTANDATYADPNAAFEAAGAPPADHDETHLALGGTNWLGIPTLDSGYERYWNVAYPDDANGNGTADAVRVAVIVRWPVGAGFRRVVLISTKANPLDAR